MWRILYNVLDLFANNSARALLTSLGIGLVSATAVSVLLSQYIDTALSQASTMPFLGLLGLFGIVHGDIRHLEKFQLIQELYQQISN